MGWFWLTFWRSIFWTVNKKSYCKGLEEVNKGLKKQNKKHYTKVTIHDDDMIRHTVHFIQITILLNSIGEWIMLHPADNLHLTPFRFSSLRYLNRYLCDKHFTRVFELKNRVETLEYQDATFFRVHSRLGENDGESALIMVVDLSSDQDLKTILWTVFRNIHKTL